jgi:hypothetical protein
MIGKFSKHISGFIVIAMMMNMLWLTISLPFIADGRFGCQLEQSASKGANPFDTQGEDTGFPQTGSSEEKGSEGSNGYNEEYLHHHEGILSMALKFGKTTMHDLAQDAYCAFHGELLVPPPNVI